MLGDRDCSAEMQFVVSLSRERRFRDAAASIASDRFDVSRSFTATRANVHAMDRPFIRDAPAVFSCREIGDGSPRGTAKSTFDRRCTRASPSQRSPASFAANRGFRFGMPQRDHRETGKRGSVIRCCRFSGRVASQTPASRYRNYRRHARRYCLTRSPCNFGPAANRLRHLSRFSSSITGDSFACNGMYRASAIQLP